MERFRGRRIKGSGVWKTFMLKKEFGKEIDGVWVEQLYRLPKNKNVETIKKHIFRHSIEQNKFQMLLRTNHLKHTLVHLELRSCACSVISIMSNSVTLWTVAHQAPLPMGFSRQEYWIGLPCPPSGDLPNPGIKLASPKSPALAGRFFTTSATSSTEINRLHMLSLLKKYRILRTYVMPYDSVVNLKVSSKMPCNTYVCVD